MNKNDVMRLTHPIQLLGLTIVLSSIAVSAASTLMASSDVESEAIVPTTQVELWKIQ